MSNDTQIAEVLSSDVTALCALLARILQRCIAEQDAQIMALLSSLALHFLPLMRLIDGLIEYKEATGTLVTSQWRQRNRRASNSLSPVLIHFIAPYGKLYLRLLALGSIPPILTAQQHPGSKKPKNGIPSEEWPNVVSRVIENQEPLRMVADDYGVSYETVRRAVLAARQQMWTG
jgi:hypothetical protein